MTINFLDCRQEVSPQRDIPPTRRPWLATEIKDQDWIITTDQSLLKELDNLANFIEQNPLQNLQRNITDYNLPHCQAAMQKTKTILEDGIGFAVLDRLPIDQYPIETTLEIYWLLGQIIGRPVAQKWNGQMLYSVRDTGKQYSYGVRGSHTSVELVFHTDNAFAKMVPDYVGLLCRNPAKSGGISRFCSLYTVHQRMQEQYPEALQRLYQPMYFDRQKEHAENAPKVCLAPYFSWHNDRLNARANSALVRQGYQVANQTMDTALEDALNAIDEVSTSPDIWFEAPLERGQIQYLNNHEVAHYRSHFIDHDEPENKRHLYRLWHRECGTVCYDGERI